MVHKLRDVPVPESQPIVLHLLLTHAQEIPCFFTCLSHAVARVSPMLAALFFWQQHALRALPMRTRSATSAKGYIALLSWIGCNPKVMLYSHVRADPHHNLLAAAITRMRRIAPGETSSRSSCRREDARWVLARLPSSALAPHAETPGGLERKIEVVTV